MHQAVVVINVGAPVAPKAISAAAMLQSISMHCNRLHGNGIGARREPHSSNGRFAVGSDPEEVGGCSGGPRGREDTLCRKKVDVTVYDLPTPAEKRRASQSILSFS